MEDDEELANAQDAPPFHVRQVGRTTMLEASKGVDWLSMFPNEGVAVTEADPPKLIDLPLQEPLALSPSADPPAQQAMPWVDLSGAKRLPLAEITIAALALFAIAIVLELFVLPTRIQPRPASSASANDVSNDRLADDRLTVQALAPATSSSPVPTPVAREPATTIGRARDSTPARTTPGNARAPASGTARTAATQPSPPPPTRRAPSPTPTTTVQAPLRSAPTPTPIALATTAPTPTATPEPTFSPKPQPAATPSSLGIAAPPPGAVPASRSTTTPLLSSPRPSPAPNSAAAATAAVRSVLDQYRAAYESLRSESVQAVWPAVNTRALARAFDQIASQSVEFDSCGIELNATGAEATCAGRLTFVPKVGGKVPRVENRRWTFNLRRQNDRWIIDSVVSR